MVVSVSSRNAIRFESFKKRTIFKNFQNFFNLDISKVGGDDSWEDYERCEALSCHASELSYEFSVEKTLDCPSLAKDKGEMVDCQVRLCSQNLVTIFA